MKIWAETSDKLSLFVRDIGEVKQFVNVKNKQRRTFSGQIFSQ